VKSSQLTREQTDQALRELGVDPAEFVRVQQAPTYQEAMERLTAFKLDVKKRYRNTAFRLHPDRNEGNKVQQDLFVLCTQLNEQIQSLKLRAPVRPRVMTFPTRAGRITINIKVRNG
jgi:hypothetical protein